MKHFCSECGKPTEYTSSLPKFCSFCGFGFAAATKTITPTTPPKRFSKDQFKIKLNTTPEHTSSTEGFVEASEEEIDSEDYDTSRFRGIKPKFTFQTVKPVSESFGSILDAGAAAVKSGQSQGNISEEPPVSQGIIQPPIQQPSRPVELNPILAEFAKEAGASRQD